MVKVERGTCVVILPETPQRISFCVEGSPTIFYVHFTGAAIDELADFMGLESITFRKIYDCAAFEILFNRLVKNFLPLKAINGRRPIYVPKVNGLLLQLLDYLSSGKLEKGKPDQDAITAALLYINEHFCDKLTVSEVAQAVGVSARYLTRLFQEHLNLGVSTYITYVRISKAIDFKHQNPQYPLTDLALDMGFGSQQHFSKVFKERMGVSPKKYFSIGTVVD